MSFSHFDHRVQADESALALFRRKAGRPFDIGIPLFLDLERPGRSRPGLYSGDVVEVCGSSGSGKTEVLMHAVAHVLVVPDSVPNDRQKRVSESTIAMGSDDDGSDQGSGAHEDQVNVGPAREGAAVPKQVVWMDHDGRLDVARLSSILRHRVKAVNPQLAAVGLEERVSEALELVSVVRCASTFEVVAALQVLHVEIKGGNRETLVVVDSIGAMHFMDRQTELVAGEGAALAGPLVRQVSKLLKERPVLVLAAKPSLFKPRRGQAFEHREYLPPGWQQLVVARLCLAKRSSQKSAQKGAKKRREEPPAPAVFDMWVSKDHSGQAIGRTRAFSVAGPGIVRPED